MPEHADDDRERLKAAVDQLNGVLSGVATDVVSRIHERCPYRAADERCTFAGGCVNQRRLAGSPARHFHCGGDHQLRRDRA